MAVWPIRFDLHKCNIVKTNDDKQNIPIKPKEKIGPQLNL